MNDYSKCMNKVKELREERKEGGKKKRKREGMEGRKERMKKERYSPVIPRGIR